MARKNSSSKTKAKRAIYKILREEIPGLENPKTMAYVELSKIDRDYILGLSKLERIFLLESYVNSVRAHTPTKGPFTTQWYPMSGSYYTILSNP